MFNFPWWPAMPNLLVALLALMLAVAVLVFAGVGVAYTVGCLP